MLSLVPWSNKKEDRGETAPYVGHPLARFWDEMDSLFDRWRRRPAPFDAENGWNRIWDCHLEDNESEFVIKAELPGFEPDELDVQTSGQVLTIKAEKKDEGREEKRYRCYHRSLTLPEGVEWDRIDARYKNGVLTVHLPKTERSKGKRIAVKV